MSDLSEANQHRLDDIQGKVETYLKLGRPDAAENTIRSAMEHTSLRPYLHNLLGTVLSGLGQFGDAAEQFLEAIRQDPGLLPAKLNLVISLCDVSEYDKAIEIYQGSIDQMKRVPELVTEHISKSHLRTARSYEEADLMAEAMAEYQRALTFDESLAARLALARIYIKLGYLDKAEQELDHCERRQVQDTNLMMWHGVLYVKTGRWQNAENAFERALELDPTNLSAKAYLSYVKTYLKAQDSAGSRQAKAWTSEKN